MEWHKDNVASKSNVEAVYAKLRKNKFKCALSGIELTPDNFCIDHIQSMADGGTNDIANLQCVHPLVNRMKGTMSNEQFVDMCRRVAEAQEYHEGTHPPV